MPDDRNTDPNHVTVRELYDLLDKSQGRMLQIVEQVEQRIASTLAEHLRGHDSRVLEPIEQQLARHEQEHEGMATGRRWLLTTWIAVTAVLGMVAQLVITLMEG